jgi:1-acyl-sn-glycerol-3-phosphate acyltransferase
MAWRLKKLWGHIMLFFSGIFYRVYGKEAIDKKQAYVICPNHASYLDIILTNVIFPNYFHFMGKAELLHVPLFGIFFKRMNIPVNRGSMKASHQAFERAKSDLDKNISIAIFPEATIPNCAPSLGPFKNGAFRLAIEKKVPVIPITFLDNWKLFPDTKRNRFICRPGYSRIIIHHPIKTTEMDLDEVSTLKKNVHDCIAAKLNANECRQSNPELSERTGQT